MNLLAWLFGRGDRNGSSLGMERVAEILSAGPMLVHPEHFENLLTRIAADNRASSRKAGERPSLQPTQGVAKVSLRGVLMKRAPGWAVEYGYATDLTDSRNLILEAAARPDVRQIVLDIESPGGTLAGTQELGDAIYQARSSREILTQVEDLCASAAYWTGAQAHKISANSGAFIGSIGVYSVLYDASALAEKWGVKVDVVRSTPLKGAGVLGAPISAEQREKEQQLVNDAAALFVSAVARGRGISIEAAQKLATGECWMAAQSLSLGLIDSVVGLGAEDKPTPEPEPAPDPDPEPAPEARIPDPAPRVEEPRMSTPTTASAPDLKAENEALARRVAELEATEKRRAFEAHAAKLKFLPGLSAGATVDALMAVDGLPAKEKKLVLDCLTSCNAAMEQSAIFGRFGSSIAADATDSETAYMDAARKIAASEQIPLSVAMTKVADLHPELAAAYGRDQLAKTQRK